MFGINTYRSDNISNTDAEGQANDNKNTFKTEKMHFIHTHI